MDPWGPGLGGDHRPACGVSLPPGASWAVPGGVAATVARMEISFWPLARLSKWQQRQIKVVMLWAWEMDETTLEEQDPEWGDRKEAKGCFEECRRRVPFPAPPTRRGAPQAVLRREEGGLPRTEHQRRRLRLPRLRPVLHLLALVLLPLCAGLPGVQPAGGAPRRQDGRRGLGGLRLCFCHLRSLIICYGARTSP